MVQSVPSPNNVAFVNSYGGGGTRGGRPGLVNKGKTVTNFIKKKFIFALVRYNDNIRKLGLPFINSHVTVY